LGIVKIYLHNYLLTMIITDLPYFGTISFLQEIVHADSICFDNNAPFSKMSFKNRIVIASAQGPLHLTIPIVGGRDQKTPINEVLISYDTPWSAQHFKAIISSYKRSPYFEYYQASLEHLYESKPARLIDFLMNCHLWIQLQLKGKWQLIDLESIPETELIKWDRHYHSFLPKNYNKIENPIKYQQVFEEKVGFIPNLSILDLLFCVGGKQAHNFLKT
jgi:hypothetical protein